MIVNILILYFLYAFTTLLLGVVILNDETYTAMIKSPFKINSFGRLLIVIIAHGVWLMACVNKLDNHDKTLW